MHLTVTNNLSLSSGCFLNTHTHTRPKRGVSKSFSFPNHTKHKCISVEFFYSGVLWELQLHLLMYAFAEKCLIQVISYFELHISSPQHSNNLHKSGNQGP